MKKIIQILGAAVLVALLVSACGLLGGDEDSTSVQLRISNQTGLDFEWLSVVYFTEEGELLRLEFPAVANGNFSDYLKIPFPPEEIVFYPTRVTAFSDEIGLELDFGKLFLSSNPDRTVPITTGKYTFLLEFTSRDYVSYGISQDIAREEGFQIRLENVSTLDFEQVSIWLPDPEGDPDVSEEFEIGAISSGEMSGYEAVHGAVEFTRIRVVTAAGDTLDNEPLDHFGWDLPTGDYTYHVNIRTNNFHDISRIIKD